MRRVSIRGYSTRRGILLNFGGVGRERGGLSWTERTERVIGAENVTKLQSARVALLGLGGVGGACAEALCRAGIGHLLLIDGDAVEDSNRNRQLLATASTVGLRKVEAAEKRLHEIVPEADLTLADEFLLPENSAFLFDWMPDYVVDAVDTVAAKLFLAKECAARDIPLVMCLGTGNRLHPELLRLGDLSETAGTGCPLARVMRRELRKAGIEHLSVLFSTEEPVKAHFDGANGRHPPGSISFVPPAAGYFLAGKCVRDLIGAK